MLNLSSQTLVVFITALLGITHATPAPDATINSPAARSVGPQPGCPSPISITNGGFETGRLAPWTVLSNTTPGAKQHIVSPGAQHRSKHALQIDAPAANITEYSLEQSTNAQECFGYYYNISYAWNWVSYSGPEGAPPTDSSSDPGYCAFFVDTGYTYVNVPRHYGTRKPGWHRNSYVARDVYSHCQPAVGSYVVNVVCVGGDAETEVLPGFSIRVDDLSITNAPGSPDDPPIDGC